MKPEDVNFHDAVIYRVIEDTRTDSLSFEVDYPLNWEQNLFERKLITFTDVLNY